MVTDIDPWRGVRLGLTDPASFSLPRGGAFSAVFTWTRPDAFTGYGLFEASREVASSIRQRTRPTWVPEFAERMNRILALGSGWDGCGGAAPRLTTVVAAIQLLSGVMGDTTPTPGVFPTNSGGVLLDWHQGGIDLEVELSGARVVEVSFFDHWNPAVDRDAELATDPGGLRGVLTELTRRESGTA